MTRPIGTAAELERRRRRAVDLVDQGESIPVNNPPAPIQTEAKAKDVRFLLEALHGQITRAAQDGYLPTNLSQQALATGRTILHLWDLRQEERRRQRSFNPVA